MPPCFLQPVRILLCFLQPASRTNGHLCFLQPASRTNSNKEETTTKVYLIHKP